MKLIAQYDLKDYLESGDVSLNIDSSDSNDKTIDNKNAKIGIKNSIQDTLEKN